MKIVLEKDANKQTVKRLLINKKAKELLMEGQIYLSFLFLLFGE